MGPVAIRPTPQFSPAQEAKTLKENSNVGLDRDELAREFKCQERDVGFDHRPTSEDFKRRKSTKDLD